MPMPPMSNHGPGPLWPVHYGPAPIPLRHEPHIPLTPKTGMRREEIERRIAEAGVTAEEKAAWNAKYQKPSTGIPKTDLASGVQASIDKADTALQEHQSLSGYVQKSVLFDNPDTNPMVKSALLPSYVDDVLEYDSLSLFPATGETGKIYVAKDTNKTYRWTGTQYVQVGGDEQAQADWTQTDSGAPDFIKNKPSIPAAQVNSDWNASSGAAQILNKPTIPTVPTNVSAFTNDAGYLTQHQSLSAYRTASAQDAIDGAQDTAIAAKYTKPSSGIPASDLAAGAIPTALPNPQPLHVGAMDYDGSTETWVPGADMNGGCGIVTLESATNSTHETGYAATPLAVKTVADSVAAKATATSLAPAFSSSSTYAVGDYVTYEGLLYKCTTAVSTAGAWDAADWTAVAVADEMGGVGAPKNVWYVGSTTGAGSTISGSTTTGDFVLAEGNVVVVKMSYGVNATSATLNIDGTGAKQISTRSGTTTFPKYFWSNDQAIAFVYSGTYYIPCGVATATAYNSWGLTSLSSTVSNDETKAATPKAVNTRAPLASPAFTGTPTAPTAAAGTNTTQIATTAFVQTEVAGKADAASLRYSLPAAISVSDATSTAALQDRAVNTVQVASGVTTLNLTFPSIVAGYARDFFLRLDCAGTALATIALPSGETVDFGADALAGLRGKAGVHLAMFTEIAANHWLISARESES